MSLSTCAEHDIDHKPMDVHLTLDVSYNVSATSTYGLLPAVHLASVSPCSPPPLPACAVPLEVSDLTRFTGRCGAAS